MAAARKVISIMVDGISADTFALHRHRFPNIARLAAQGLEVGRLKSTVPATSIPGRSTMLTGVGSEVHGVWGNHILRDGTFTVPGADDIMVPTIAHMAKQAGLDVAAIGAAMVRSEDADVFLPAWWVRDYVTGSRFMKQIPADTQQAFFAAKDPEGRLARAGIEIADAYAMLNAPENHALLTGVVADAFMMKAVAALACSDTPPDLIMTEYNMIDTVEHYVGYDSPMALWTAEYGDMLVGKLLRDLDAAGRLNEYVIVIASDHGHGPVDRAIFPESILGPGVWNSEGATLYVAVGSESERREVAEKLAPFGVELSSSDHVPAEQRGGVATFVAPPRHYFDTWPTNDAATPQPVGPSKRMFSMHGFRPGAPEDDRMFIVSGAGIASEKIQSADANHFAPTLASILGLPTDKFPQPPLVQ
jgi:predicted AlkP superfamily pyrophosphatase or phosphodiesterase